MKRPDGRLSGEQIRECIFGLDVLSQVDGSARLIAGAAEAVVSVIGPTSVKSRQEQMERATLHVAVQTLSSPPSIGETHMASKLKGVLEQPILLQLHPRTLISLSVQPIKQDGLPFALLFNTCVAALIDASVPMRTTFIAMSGCLSSSGHLLLDPTEAELAEANATFSHVFDVQGASPNPVFSEVQGSVKPTDSVLLYSTMFERAKEVFAALRKTARARLEL